MQGIEIRPIIEIIEDPSAIVEAAVDLLEGKRASSWMQRLRGRSSTGAGQRNGSGVPTWDGRACCAEQLGRLANRGDLVLPFDTKCPACQRVYRIRYDLVPVKLPTRR